MLERRTERPKNNSLSLTYNTPIFQILHTIEFNYFTLGLLTVSSSVLLLNWFIWFNVSSSFFSSTTSFPIRKLGWFVDDRSLAHILSVITTLFCFSVIRCKIEQINVNNIRHGQNGVVSCAHGVEKTEISVNGHNLT